MIFLIKKIKVTVNYIKKEFFYVHSNFNFFLIIRKIFVIEGNFIIRKISYFFIKRRSNDLSFLFSTALCLVLMREAAVLSAQRAAYFLLHAGQSLDLQEILNLWAPPHKGH